MVEDEEDESFDAAIEDDTFSKVIEEDDVVKAIFEPDEEDEINLIPETVGTTAQKAEKEAGEELELTVQQKRRRKKEMMISAVKSWKIMTRPSNFPTLNFRPWRFWKTQLRECRGEQ